MEQSFTQAKLQAERAIQNHSRHPWSPKLRLAQLQVYYYKSWLSQYQTGKDYTIQRSRFSLTGVTLPNNKQETQVLLRQAQKHLRQIRLQAQKLRDQHLEDRVAYANL